MKLKTMLTVLIAVLCLMTFLPGAAVWASSSPDMPSVSSWELRWEQADRVTTLPDQADAAGEWQTVQARDGWTGSPEGVESAWVRMTLPMLQNNWAALFPKVYGQDITVYLDGEVLFHTTRDIGYDLNRVLISLKKEASGETLYLHMQGNTERLGLDSGFEFGNYQNLVRAYANEDLIDMIIGFAYIFVAFVMLVCSVFLVRQQLKMWLSLCFIILPIGGLMIGYSPYPYTFYGQHGSLFQMLFDTSLNVFLPALIIFFEQLFGRGHRNIITYFRRFLIVYSSLVLATMVVYYTFDVSIYKLYMFVSVTMMGYVMIALFLLIIIMLIRELWNRNVDSIIIASGLAVFSVVSIGELALFYSSSQTYQLSWWKWGLIAFVLSLIVVLGRRIAYQHKLIVSYSRDLEIYNSEIQRSEKMEIISQLAASVAHEVRNPLQVTRGLLQILGEKNNNGSRSSTVSEENYYQLAIDELDRASVIITDFLTFAKPQMEQIVELNLAEEFKHVEGIIVPLANLQGGKLEVNMPRSLRIMGNSSKLKQAIINLIKNSIEALEGSGIVRVWAYEEREHVVIHIADSGNGMDEQMLARLGEPYFSNKSKGTGLGLMVTFRIIELMKGTITFKSELGVGTEAMIRFPAARYMQTNAKVI
ncbi:sensor histidine kinase [Paenibacillus sacheonensis]|uniref:histidine kinase n=1 Tax=Paenibacillus sacheonensis TaxID=742054 RepID=A0A7X4YPS1_9BACL|nr:HAMP domain-containing sensor histidine kinase [Paenibacillus sacheonensis]MBM7564806.1 signal transduction histidine kinase [Paenibacillus sacheonensis]NBC69354.1 sensor histidine kinase [Paenibacillus sacheonensis]